MRLQEAYRGLLMTGRYAVAFLFLDVPPDQVDVNVHPTKAEVRFRDSQALHHLVFSTIRDRLDAENLTARLQVPSTIHPSGEIVPNATPLFDRLRAPPLAEPWTLTPIAASPGRLPSAAAAVHETCQTRQRPSPPVPSHRRSPSSLPSLPASHKVIQLYDAYLVLETDKGMLVIDQHALHERILFEQLKARLRNGPLETQRLLIPEPVDLSAEQAARVAGDSARRWRNWVSVSRTSAATRCW